MLLRRVPSAGAFRRGFVCGAVFVRRIAVILATCQFIGGGSAQHLDRMHYPERLHEDLELLRTALHEAHPDPYRYHTRAELDALIDAVRDSITTPMSIVGFQELVNHVLKAVGDSHCRSAWPIELEEELNTRIPLIPLQVRLLPEGVFLESELKGFRSIPVGSRMLSINGLDMDIIRARLVNGVVADGANRTYAERVVEREFPQRYCAHIGHSTAFRVRYVTPSKEIGEQEVFALTGEEIARSRKPNGAALLPWGSTWYPESSTMWVTLRTLDHDSLMASGQRPDRILQGMLSEAQAEGARTLVLDVRGAGGNELAVAQLIHSMIAKASFTMLDDLIIRSVAAPEDRPSHDIPAEFYASVDPGSLVADQGRYRLPDRDERLAQHEPNERVFQGKVYLVCDGGTRDAAAALVMMAKRTGRARIVGEETGSNALAFTGGPQWTVTGRGTGMRFFIPLLKYVPSGRVEGPVDRGEQPHHAVTAVPASLAQGRDSIKNALLEMIRELQ